MTLKQHEQGRRNPPPAEAKAGAGPTPRRPRKGLDRKPHGRSHIDTLPLEQREQLDRWLFEENLDYKHVVRDFEVQHGTRLSPRMLSHYYHREPGKQAAGRIKRNMRQVDETMRGLQANPARTHQAVSTMIGQAAFEEIIKSPKEVDPKNLHLFVRMLMDVQKLALSRERFEFDAAEACHRELPELKAIASEPGLSTKEKVRRIRIKLFGAAPE